MTAAAHDDCGVVILAGGAATRLPNKLSLDAGNVPLLVRVYRNVADTRATYLSCNAPLMPELAALVPAQVVIDRWPRGGPLGGLLSTLEAVPAPWIFAVAGDAPHINAALIATLLRSREPGDEAVVPRHDGRLEPLAALYERAAFLREGSPVFHQGRGALIDVIARLRTRFIDIEDTTIFTNINTPADYAALHGTLA
jgi:molybdopterin-guanine dinucleotide biosynthesis protein A